MALRRIAESRDRKHGKDEVIQEFGTVYPVPIGLGENVRSASANALNPLLANTMVLRDLYKKHHWQVSGATFYQLHLLFDKHYAEQVELMDALAERVTALGGVPLAAPQDVAEAWTAAMGQFAILFAERFEPSAPSRRYRARSTSAYS